MKKLIFLLTIVGLLWLPQIASAQTASAKPADTNPQAKKLCETVSMITGVAISPMLGVSGVGAYKYFQAKTFRRKRRKKKQNCRGSPIRCFGFRECCSSARVF